MTAAPPRRLVFVTGATGYLGRALIPELLRRGHRVRALVRPASEARLPRGVELVPGDAIVAETFAPAVRPADTLSEPGRRLACSGRSMSRAAG